MNDDSIQTVEDTVGGKPFSPIFFRSGGVCCYRQPQQDGGERWDPRAGAEGTHCVDFQMAQMSRKRGRGEGEILTIINSISNSHRNSNSQK